jgi:excisionase family DNA binding protein
MKQEGGSDMDPNVLDIQGAADLFGVSPATIRAEAREGRLPGRRLGRHWRFSRPALLDWLGVDEDDEPLSPEALSTILQSRADYERGDSITLEEYECERRAEGRRS